MALFCRVFLGDLFTGFLIDHLHRQADLAAIVKAQELDLHVLTFLEHVARVVQAAVLDLADMHQPVTLAEEVHESPEIDDLDDLAVIDLALFRLGHDRPDHVIGLLDRLAVGRRNLDDPLVVDVDLGTRHFDDLADHLAARPDDFTDLVGGDLHGLDARRVDAEISGPRKRLVHLAQDMHAPGFRLFQRLLHDLGRDARDLDIHLQRGDALCGAGHLEIHVAKVIFVTEDIRQDRELAVFFEHKAHGYTGNGCLERHARIHHRQRPATDRSHGGRAVRFRDLRHQTDGVGEIGRGRQNRLERAPRKLAMADFTPSRRAHAPGFAHRIGGEVVVQQEVRFEIPVQRVDELLVVAGAKRGDHQALRLATGEQRRAVGTRQQAGFTDDRADLIQTTTVDAIAVLDDITAQHDRLELFHGRAKVAVFKLLFAQLSLDRVFGGGNRRGTFLLSRMAKAARI